MEKDLYMLMCTDNRFICKDMPHPILNFISNKDFIENLSLTSLRLIYREALFWKHKNLKIIEEFISKKQTQSKFPQFKFFTFELKFKSLLEQNEIKEAFDYIAKNKDNTALPNHIIFELYYKYIMNSPIKPKIEYLKELFDFFNLDSIFSKSFFKF